MVLDLETKTIATPQVWDTLERPIISTVADIGNWGSVNVLSISSNQKRTQFSNYAAHYNFTADATAGFRGVNDVLSSWRYKF